jgi:hypothetical protein
MVQFWSAVSVIVVVVPAAILAIWGWRRRVRRQQGVPELASVPAGLEVRSSHRGKYVATTTAGDRLDRIAVRGLAFRGLATAVVTDEGLIVARDGEVDLWIARDSIVGVERATWTIDRVVERDGLHQLRWRLADREVDTYLRLDEPRAFDEAIAPLLPVQAAAPAGGDAA